MPEGPVPTGPAAAPDPGSRRGLDTMPTQAPDDESVAGVGPATPSTLSVSSTAGSLSEDTSPRPSTPLLPSDGRAGAEEPAPGRVIAGRYRLIAHLGAGGHGEVWSADDLVLREPVALKWIRQAAGL